MYLRVHIYVWMMTFSSAGNQRLICRVKWTFLCSNKLTFPEWMHLNSPGSSDSFSNTDKFTLNAIWQKTKKKKKWKEESFVNLLMGIHSSFLLANTNEFTILCLLIFINDDVQGKITLENIFIHSKYSLMQVKIKQKKFFSNIHLCLSHLPVKREYHMLDIEVSSR